MTAKRPSGEAFEEAPSLEKRGRIEEAGLDPIDAELDDEVEKELREFERLQSNLLSAPTKEGNVKTGGMSRSGVGGKENKVHEQSKEVVEESHAVEREVKELECADGSDMEIDDLEHEIEEAREKNAKVQLRMVSGVPNESKDLVLNGTATAEDVRSLPDGLAEENLLGEGVEKSHILEDREEASEDIEEMQLFKDRQAADSLFSSQDQVSSLKPEQALPPDAQELLRSAQEILKAMKAKRQELDSETPEEDPNDPDFPSPGKRKHRNKARNNRSKSRRSQFSPEKNCAHQELPSSKSQTRLPENNFHTSVDDPSILERLPPKEVFVDPVLKIPVQPKSLYKDPKFRDPIFDHVSQPKAHHTEDVSTGIFGLGKEPVKDGTGLVEQSGEERIAGATSALGKHHVRAIDFNQTTTKADLKVINSLHPRSKSPSLNHEEPHSIGNKLPKHSAYLDSQENSKHSAKSAYFTVEQDQKEPASSPQNRSDGSQHTQAAVNITRDLQAYCVVERIIRKRYENSLLLDNEKMDMIEAERPKIRCPELSLYTSSYNNRKWLAACNELKRFFCWPCLFFGSKTIWSVTCDENLEIVIKKEINRHQQAPVHQESTKQFDTLMIINKSSVVSNILNNLIDKERVIMKGRPRPIMDNIADHKSKASIKLALEEFYDQVQWICGCAKSNKFYCWPCLLFNPDKLPCWDTISSVEAGFMLSQHETSQLHIEACFKLARQEFDLRNKLEAKKGETEKTHTFVKCLVEVLCAEKKKINNVDFSPLDFADSLELMSRYNKTLQIFLDEKSKISSIVQIIPQYTPAIQESVEFLIKKSMLEEIKCANFVSLIFDHSSGLSNKAILSVIARYVDGKGLLHERFVKLLNVGYNTPANTLIDEFFQVVTELQCRATLIGYTYDGYLVRPGNIPDFNVKVQKLCPYAEFFHYPEHSFKRVLKQALCHVPVCRKVLQAVNELASFFESTPNAKKGLLDIVVAAEKTPSGDVWRSSNFIMTVFVYHAVIVEIMESVSKNAQDWKIKTVVQASNFLDFLKDSTNRFFVTLMARIFNAVEDLSQEVERDVGIENLKTVASCTTLNIQKLGRNFENLVDSACSHLEKSEQEGPRKEMMNLREQFSNVIRLVVKLIKNRTFGLESAYFKISDDEPTSRSTYFIKLKHQNQILNNIKLPSNFSSGRLSKEMQFFHDTPIFSELNLPEITAFIAKYNMTHVLPELFKFVQLALTVPKKQLKDSTIPAVHRISAFIESKKDINSTDALIWMEKEFVSILQNKTSFYDEIADRVLAITNKELSEF